MVWAGLFSGLDLLPVAAYTESNAAGFENAAEVLMPYVQRDAHGNIQALWKEAQPDASEFLAPEHPEIEAFMRLDSGIAEAGAFSDWQMVRVIEDLIDLLIRKNLIVLTELPQAVQQKLLLQRRMRERVFGSVSVEDDSGREIF